MEGDASFIGTETTISINVKFCGTSIPISNLSLDSTIKDLKSLLQPLTNVLPRGQKLIFKGLSLSHSESLYFFFFFFFWSLNLVSRISKYVILGFSFVSDIRFCFDREAFDRRNDAESVWGLERFQDHAHGFSGFASRGIFILF